MPTLIIICGTSFSGKTTLAHHLAARLNLPEVDVDDTKDAIFGEVPDDQLSDSDFRRIYRDTDDLIEGYLVTGRSVIDASRNFTQHERDHARQICDQHHANLLTIIVETPIAVTRERLAANRITQERRDVTDAGFEEILAAWEPPTPDEQPLVFAYGETVDSWFAEHHATLSRASA